MGLTRNVFFGNVLPDQELRPLAALFPGVEEGDVQAVLDLIPLDRPKQLSSGETRWALGLCSKEVRLLTWQGSEVALPYRVYFQAPAPGALQHLTDRQQQVLHCLYLRHHDGYLRQRHLEALFALSGSLPEEFTTPFTFSLLGEYVQEILEVLEQQLTPALVARYLELICANPLYWQQTQGRVASYWDVYYRIRRRGAPRFQHYVGVRILAKLQNAWQQAALS